MRASRPSISVTAHLPENLRTRAVVDVVTVRNRVVPFDGNGVHRLPRREQVRWEVLNLVPPVVVGDRFRLFRRFGVDVHIGLDLDAVQTLHGSFTPGKSRSSCSLRSISRRRLSTTSSTRSRDSFQNAEALSTMAVPLSTTSQTSPSSSRKHAAILSPTK